MSVVFSNNAVTTLANALDSTSTSMTVVDGSQFPTISGSNFTFVTLQDISQNREIVKVTNISGNVFTIVRAQDNTTASSFIVGDKVELRLTAALLSQIDKIVNLNESGTAQVTGTYPNFTISAPSVTSAFTNDSNFLDNNSTIDAGNF